MARRSIAPICVFRPLRGNLEGLPRRSWRRTSSIHCATKAFYEAQAAPGVPVEQVQARGHIHSSFTMVDVIATAVSGREKMAQALQRFAGLEEPGSAGKQVIAVAETSGRTLTHELVALRGQAREYLKTIGVTS